MLSKSVMEDEGRQYLLDFLEDAQFSDLDMGPSSNAITYLMPCVVTVEPEQDFITCGDCQREFVLSDIVRFIQHKVNRCNKENVQPDFPNNTDYGHCDDDDDPVSVINSRRTSVSISAPIREKMSPKPSLVPTTHEDLPPLRDKRRPEDITDENDYGSSCSNNGELEANNEEDNDVKPRYIDAEANTVYSGESLFLKRKNVHILLNSFQF